MPTTLAVLITFTTYGTWLPGDERGFHDRKPDRPQPPDPVRKAKALELMRDSPLTLDAAMRRVVRQTIEEHCRFRGWNLYPLHVRANQVHAVIFADWGAQRGIGSLKARATRRLREEGLVHADQPVWTAEGGNARPLKHPDAIKEACDYVLYKQGEPLPEG